MLRALYGHLRTTLFLTFFFSVGILGYIFFAERNSVLTVAFLDVGQGDSIFIETKEGIQILIDGGGDRKVLRELSRLMSFFDRSIDIVIATHADKDHIGGLPDVFKRFRVGAYVKTNDEGESGAYETLEYLVVREESTIITVDGAMSLDLGGGAMLAILFPDRDLKGVASNIASIISKLAYGEHEFLFMADAPKNIEEYVVARYGASLESDVLKVGHHGSKTSSGKDFIATVRPTYAIISAGKDNRYGHPHQEVIDSLEVSDAEIVSTIHGTVIFESDGTTLKRK
jgi:competence protein ComEC